MAEESTRVGILVSPEMTKVSLVGQFQKLDPPKFKGDEGPEVAEDFINDLEKIFNVLGCTPEEKLLMAEFSLQRGAEAWWKASRDSAVTIHVGDAWTVFKGAFLGKYFPFSFREDKALEFANLTQRGLTVDEYEGRFTALSRYGPPMDAESKARKFELGLNPEIRLQLAPLMLTSYEDIYRRAQNIEKALAAVKVKEEAESSRRTTMSGLPPRKRFRSGGSFLAPRPFVARPFRPPISPRMNLHGRSQRVTTVRPPLCHRCNGHHYGFVCPMNEIICYQCGRPGHMRRNCPQGGAMTGSGMSGSSAPRPRGGMRPAPTVSATRGSVSGPVVSARLNAITEADVNASRGVISGTVRIRGELVHALFDTGATHSFVSCECVEKYGWPVDKVEKRMRIVLPTGDEHGVIGVCRGCELIVTELRFEIDLLVF